MIEVSQQAKEKLLSLMREEGHKKAVFVRVGVNSGGCSGLSYDLGVDTNKNEDDKLFEHTARLRITFLFFIISILKSI